MNPSHILWYDKSASNWNEALPLGNGRIGVMVYGGTDTERLCLNEDTLWSGYARHVEQPGAYAAYTKAKALAHAGKYREAEKVLEQGLTALPSQMYLPLGDLTLYFPAEKHSLSHGDVTNYRRELDLSTGVSTVTYNANDIDYTRTLFVSHPAQAMVLRLTASQPSSFTVRFSSQLRVTIRAEKDTITADGQCPSTTIERGLNQGKAVQVYEEDPVRQGIRFRTLTSVDTDGTVTADGTTLTVDDYTTATLILTVRTSFNGWDKLPVPEGRSYIEPCADDLKAARKSAYEILLREHITDHRALYDRCELTLPGGDEGMLPTDVRLVRHAEGKGDPALYALLFHYGRYLTIAASREGTQATNLQGIWNPLLMPPWSSNYTININTEMNYWPTLMTNLTECAEPLNRLIKELSVSGRRTAREYYGADGFCSHHNTDLWRLSTPVGNGQEGCCVYAYWPLSAGWFMRHLWEYWEYTGNLAFLEHTAYPIFEDCCRFYLDVLDRDTSGKLVFCPSTSPENRFRLPDGTPNAVAESAAMTEAIIRDVFGITLAAADILGRNDALTDKVHEALPDVKPYDLTATGAIREWNEDFPQTEPHHRHLSHLYGNHPGREIAYDTPLADAVRQTLEERGDAGTGWSLGWKINHWARLRDGNRALKLIDMQLCPTAADAKYPTPGGSYPNLLDAHPPFQIDGNFGATAGIVEMLLQGTADAPVVLPALPDAWRDGEVRGLRIRGGAVVDIAWKDGNVTKLDIKCL